MTKKFHFFSRKLTKTIIVIAVFGMFVFFNPKNFFQPVRSAMLWFFSPVEKIIYGASQKISFARNFVFSLGELKEDNEKLIKENQELQSQNAKLKDVDKENAFLRQQLDLLPRNKFQLAAANIIAQDPYAAGNWIEIDKGEKDGIKEGMPVIISEGILLGKIGEIGFSTSKIILITNPESAINGVDFNTEAKGITKGVYGLGIVLDMVLTTETLNVGDQVVTSGLGMNMPRGLLIGKIQEIKSSPDRLFQQAVISSPINFSRLFQVFIIKDPINDKK